MKRTIYLLFILSSTLSVDVFCYIDRLPVRYTNENKPTSCLDYFGNQITSSYSTDTSTFYYEPTTNQIEMLSKCDDYGPLSFIALKENPINIQDLATRLDCLVLHVNRMEYSYDVEGAFEAVSDFVMEWTISGLLILLILYLVWMFITHWIFECVKFVLNRLFIHLIGKPYMKLKSYLSPKYEVKDMVNDPHFVAFFKYMREQEMKPKRKSPLSEKEV